MKNYSFSILVILFVQILTVDHPNSYEMASRQRQAVMMLDMIVIIAIAIIVAVAINACCSIIQSV